MSLRLVMSAEAERAAVVERVAEAIWAAQPASPQPVSWTTLRGMAGRRTDEEGLQAAELLRAHRAQARAAIAALMIGDDGLWPGAERMLRAGEAIFEGPSICACALMFDSMLAEVLTT